MKFYKRLMRFIQIFVILVVLPRVASFVMELSPHSPGIDLHDIIAWAFAATLGLGVISTAYFSDESPPPEYDDEPANARERRRREREAAFYATMLQAAPYARRALYFFAFLDGSFNLADALMGASASGLFDIENPILIGIYSIATVLFGISPTILAIVLAKVISMVDRIPEDYERPSTKREIDLLRTVMGNLGLTEYKHSDAANLLRSPTEQGRTNIERSPNGGDQKERIEAYISHIWQTENRIPGPSEISQAIGVAKSYASEVTRKFTNQFDPFTQ